MKPNLFEIFFKKKLLSLVMAKTKLPNSKVRIIIEKCHCFINYVNRADFVFLNLVYNHFY